MPRAGLTRDRVVAAAEALADELGLARLTFALLAGSLGVRQPSLYKHVDGLPDLRRAMAARAKTELTAELAGSAVGRARGDAVTAMALAYRRWANDHPGRYAAIQRAPEPGDAEDEAASGRLVGVLTDVVAGYDLRGADAVDAIRFVRAALHGFVSLESDAVGGFTLPIDVDRSFDRLVRAVVTALASWAAAGSGASPARALLSQCPA